MPPYASPENPEGGGRLHGRLSLVFVGLAIVTAILPPDSQNAAAGLLRGTALRPFLAIQEGRASARARAAEVADLQAQIDALTQQVMATTTMAEENRRLRGLLDLGARLGPLWRPVQVLRPGTPQGSILIIDQGEESGVRANAPLIARDGLAGIIRESTVSQAVGMDWTHPEFQVSAMTRDGLHFGFVRPERGLFQGGTSMILDDVPFYATIEPGAEIVTSGLGGTYPRGIPVGRVASLREAEGQWRKSFVLEPFVEAGSVTLALVGLPGVQDASGLPAGGGLDPDAAGTDTGDTVAAAQAASVEGAWGAGPLLRADERMVRDALLADSVRILRDSLARLEAVRVRGGEVGGR